MHHADVHAAQHQAIGGLQAEQAAADDHGFFVFGGRVNHGVGVGDVAVGDHALQVLARHGEDEGVGTGAHQQAVVFFLGDAAVGIHGAHDAFDAVHLDHLFAGMQRDVVVGVPVPAVQDDLVERLLAGQYRRQQDAVVVGMRLGAENRDVVKIGGDLEQLLERAYTCHAVADHDQSGFFHRATPRECCVAGACAEAMPACKKGEVKTMMLSPAGQGPGCCR